MCSPSVQEEAQGEGRAGEWNEGEGEGRGLQDPSPFPTKLKTAFPLVSIHLKTLPCLFRSSLPANVHPQPAAATVASAGRCQKLLQSNQ